MNEELLLAARAFRRAYEMKGVLDWATYKDAKLRLWHAIDALDATPFNLTGIVAEPDTLRIPEEE